MAVTSNWSSETLLALRDLAKLSLTHNAHVCLFVTI